MNLRHVRHTLSGLSGWTLCTGKLFTLLLSLTVLVVAAWMIRSFLAAKRGWDRTRYRWLLLCTLAGISPYVFLDKFPTLLAGDV